MIHLLRLIKRRIFSWFSFARFFFSPKSSISDVIEKRVTEIMSTTKVGMGNSTYRDEWVKEQIQTLPANLEILDAGAGEQQYKPLCSHLKYTSQDHAAYDGAGDGKGGQVTSWTYGNTDIISDIVSIPRPDKSFDAILCTEVLEHVPDPVKALSELSRLLKPNGVVLITAPFCSFTHFSPYHFCTGFSRYWYSTHLQELGISLLKCSPNGNYFDYVGQELRRLDSMAAKYAGSPLSLLQRVLIAMLIILLEKLSKSDSGSSEYACFGWHICGIKNAQ